MSLPPWPITTLNHPPLQVFALGFVSVFEQIGEGLEAGTRDEIFTAYINALDESPATYRKDAAALEEWAKSLSSAEDVAPNADGDYGQKVLATIASQVEAKKFAYSKFFAIGLFRLLELTGAKDPKALGTLVSALGVRQDMVNRDLLTYKGVLSKLSAAKELQEVCVWGGGDGMDDHQFLRCSCSFINTHRSTWHVSEKRPQSVQQPRRPRTVGQHLFRKLRPTRQPQQSKRLDDGVVMMVLSSRVYCQHAMLCCCFVVVDITAS